MPRRHAVLRWLPVYIIVSVFALTLAGCPQDPFDPNTWIEKLDDPFEIEEAITRLQRLKDPVAIKPLVAVWEEQGHSQRILKVIIELGAIKGPDGQSNWQDALPALRKAIDDFDVGDPRSVENAKLAAEAIGRAQDTDSIQSLIRVINKSMPRLSNGQQVRRAAVAALGKFGDEPRAVDTLLGVLGSDLKDQPIHLFAAAADALGETGSTKAVVPLLQALYKHAPIYQQCRRALVAIGQPAIGELTKVFRGKHPEINALAKQYKFNVSCEEMGPDTDCQAPTNLEFKSASLLGDLYAKDAAPILAAGLKAPERPAFFLPNGAPGPSQHTAILDALRKINNAATAAAVRDYWKNPETDDMLRPVAIDVYSTLTTSTNELSALAKFIKDDEQEEAVRMAAGQAYGRLARRTNQFEPLRYMIQRYKKEADKLERQAKRTQSAFDKAKKSFDQAKEAAKSDDDRRLKKAQTRLEKAQADNSLAQGRVSGYRNFQRAFEQHLARAYTGVQCKSDAKCYAEFLGKSGDAVGKEMSKYITDLKDWSEGQKNGLRIAAVERSLLELVKMKSKAASVIDTVLKNVDSTDRITRQGSLLAMVHIAPLPCDTCVTRLNEVIESQKDQSTLAALTTDTQTVRNYFLWAGK